VTIVGTLTAISFLGQAAKPVEEKHGPTVESQVSGLENPASGVKNHDSGGESPGVGWVPVIVVASIGGPVLLSRFSTKKKETVAEAVIPCCTLYGNPLRPVDGEPHWRTATVVGLAETIQRERTFDRLPILADALEEAGCARPDLLEHCRHPGDHNWGCCVVDLLSKRQ
jgi:hypothetical protein